MRRSFGFLLFALAAACAPPRAESARPVDARGAGDAAVYAAALRHLGHGGPRVPVLRDSTLALPPRAPLAGELPDELRAAFLSANASRKPLPVGELPEGLVRIAAGGALAGLPDDDPDAYWAAFNARFPGASGLLELSAVGYSADRGRAVVYVTYGCGIVCGSGHVVLLRRDGPAWRVEDARMLWVS